MYDDYEDVTDEQEEEQWKRFAEKYPKQKTRSLVRNLWNFFRTDLKVDVRRMRKSEAAGMLRDMAQGYERKRLAAEERGVDLKPTKEEGWAMRLVDKEEYLTKDGKIAFRYTNRPRGALAGGTWGEMRKIHVSRSRAGREYVRTYRRWSDYEMDVLRRPGMSVSEKAAQLDRSESSVGTKLRRMK